MKFDLLAKVSKGEIYFLNDILADRIFKKYEGKQVKIEIKSYRSTRSLKQNNWLWAMYNEIATQLYEMTGEAVEPDEIHLHNKQHLMGQSLVKFELHGEECFKFDDNSTATKNTKEFSDMAETLIKFYGERGIELITPEEYWEVQGF